MYDLIIVGAGTAGMACAITAAERGAKLLVLEKTDHVGGALHWSGGHMSAGGTRRQITMGIEDSPAAHFEDIKRINEGTGDLTLIEMAVEEAPKTIDWLDSLGFEFAPECPRIIYGHIPYDRPRTHYGTEKALSIYKVLYPLWEKFVSSGNIELHLNSTVVGLKKKNGRYTGVIAATSDGKKSFAGKNIVITTGGYGSSPDYFHSKHEGATLVSATYPSATGDGHLLAEKEGAQFRMAEYHIPSLGGLEYPRGSGRADFNKAWAMVLTSIYRQPREIYVNTLGERFLREDEENPDTRERAIIQQLDWKCWLIFDEDALLERNEDGSENPIIIGWNTERIKAEALKGEAIFKAESIEELSAAIQIPTEKLQNTIQTFNAAVAQQKDAELGRIYLKNKITTPPFYAILVHASVLVTFGGIKVNEDLQLTDEQGAVMEGLYGAGEFLGLGALSGNVFCSGMAITPALSFGRILGRKLS